MKGQVARLDDKKIEALAIYISKMKRGENNDNK